MFIKKLYPCNGNFSNQQKFSSRRKVWTKRRYEAHFVNKLTDCDGENSETNSSLDFAKDCGYISNENHQLLIGLTTEIGKMLGSMITNPKPFLKK